MEYFPFLLKLDSLDSNFDLTTNIERNAIVPLWDFNTSGRWYREFELFVEKKKYDDGASLNEASDAESAKCSPDETINYQKYRCNLCNLDVPIVYRKEHKRSPRHKLSVELADIILDRMRNDLTAANDDFDGKTPTCTYFCEPCAALVNRDNKKSHELSTSHYQSLLYDRVLKNLLKFYKDQNSLNVAELGNMAKNCLTNDDRPGSNDAEVSKVEAAETDQEKVDYLFLLSSEVKEVSSDKGQPSNEGTKSDVEIEPNKELALNYEKTVSNEEAKVETAKQVKQILKEDDDITSNDGTSLSSNIDNDGNFPVPVKPVRKRIRARRRTNESVHQIETVADDIKVASNNARMNTYYEMLTESPTRSDYKFSFVGFDRVHIFTPDECELDVSFDNFNGLVCDPAGKKYTVCRICIVLIEGSKNDHIFTTEHLERMKIPLVDKHCARKTNEKFKHCVLCNDNFFDIKCHKLMPQHQAALQAALKTQGSPATQPSQETTESNGTEDVQDDIHPQSPLGYYTSQSASDSGNQTPVLDQTYCRPCNIFIDSHNYISHTSGKNHKLNTILVAKKPVKAKMNYQFRERADKSIECMVCKSTVPNNAHNLQEHIDGGPHKKMYHQMLSNNKMKLLNKTTIRCEVCQMHIGVSSELLHINTKKHGTQLIGFTKCPVCEVPVLNTSEARTEHESTTEHKLREACSSLTEIFRSSILHPHYDQAAPGPIVRCQVCNVDVPIDESRSHLVSSLHTFKHQILLIDNKLNKISDGYFCGICNENIAKTEDVAHISSVDHILKKNNITLASVKVTQHYCEVCKVNTPNCQKNIRMHELGNRHQANLLAAEVDRVRRQCMVETNNAKVLMCSVCQVKVPANSVDEHLKGARHKDNVAGSSSG